MLHAPIQRTVFHVSVFRLQTTQGYKINRAAVLYMVITILYLNNKTVSYAHMMHVKLVLIVAPALLALVIKIITIHEICLTALVRLATTQTPLINRIA